MLVIINFLNSQVLGEGEGMSTVLTFPGSWNRAVGSVNQSAVRAAVFADGWNSLRSRSENEWRPVATYQTPDPIKATRRSDQGTKDAAASLDEVLADIAEDVSVALGDAWADTL